MDKEYEEARKIFDIHSHVNFYGDNCYFTPGYNLESLVNDMQSNNVEKSVTFLNPMIRSIRCELDIKHKAKVYDTEDGNLQIKCIDCDKEIYTGADPLREYNELLIKECRKYNGAVLPFVYLLLSNSTLQNEIEYFEKNYGGEFFGYKFHPKLSHRPIKEIEKLQTSLPLIIHTGLYDTDCPRSVLEFAKKHSGNVIFAHGSRLNKEVLQEIKMSDNLYTDTCPAIPLFKLKDSQLPSTFSEIIKHPSDIYYNLIDLVGIDSIIFGTDAPWGNISEEVKLLESLDLSANEYNKITRNNFLEVLEIND